MKEGAKGRGKAWALLQQDVETFSPACCNAAHIGDPIALALQEDRPCLLAFQQAFGERLLLRA